VHFIPVFGAIHTLMRQMRSKTGYCDAHASVQDFFQRECWAHHPKPYADFMRWRADEDARWAAESGRLIPGG
jgi:NAD-dependent SIR2 family protein deacetylase